MAQRAHANSTLNSSMTILKKMPNSQLSPRFYKRSHPSMHSTHRELSPIRLPTLLKRTSSMGKACSSMGYRKREHLCHLVNKPIPSAYIQESSSVFVFSSILIHFLSIIDTFEFLRRVFFIGQCCNQHQYFLSTLHDDLFKSTLNNIICRSSEIT
jgi:hypothetical protein